MEMRRIKFAILIAFTAAGLVTWLVGPAFVASPALARPAYMDHYNRDPYAKPELMGKCTVCHIGRGGAERNDFGDAFEDAGYRITPKLRRKFPAFFEREKPGPSGEER